MVDVVLQNAWVLYLINKNEGDEFLLLLVFQRDVVNAIFLKYSKERISSSNHVGIRNVVSNICYYDKKLFLCHFKHKAGVRCAKTPDAAS